MKAGGCPVSGKCGSCRYSGIPYQEQLAGKQKRMQKLLGGSGKVSPIIGMDDPRYYRAKVHRVLGYQKGRVLSGCYREGSHSVVDLPQCLIEDRKCQAVCRTVKDLIPSFKLRIYDEDRHSGLLRHILVRRGMKTGEIMVVLVTAGPVFPGKKNFVKALLKEHPEITTVIQNINSADTSFVLGKRETVLYGPGFIRDELCGLSFRISAGSFFQVNPVQTEILYQTAMDLAGLTGRETVIDAYCGTGTIGLAASRKAGRVIGIELNRDAAADAGKNARDNRIRNAEFHNGDAGDFMEDMARQGKRADVLFLDPPRSGSTEKFISNAAHMGPDRIVYISCGPESLKRDLASFQKKGYRVKKIQPVDMFPFTEHVEAIGLLVRRKVHADSYVNVSIDMDEYRKIKQKTQKQ